MFKKNKEEDLTLLLTKLYTIQEEVGAKPKTSDEEKRKKAEDAASMGKGRGAKKSGSRFLELKSSIVERLQTVHKLLEEQKERDKAGFAGGNNPKETIAAQAEMREQIRQATEEWKELDGLYKNEARKKRSKFTQAELEVQATLVLRLQAEIEKVKQAQMRNYARGGASDVAASLNTNALAQLDSDNFFDEGGVGQKNGGNKWTGTSSGVEVTSGQRMQMQQLQDRDADFDRQLDEIGEGIEDLAEIAQMQGEEVRRQNVMLENVGQKIDSVHEHVTSVNSKMKETLDEVGRSSDKLCVDIMCICLAVGFGAVFYNMAKTN